MTEPRKKTSGRKPARVKASRKGSDRLPARAEEAEEAPRKRRRAVEAPRKRRAKEAPRAGAEADTSRKRPAEAPPRKARASDTAPRKARRAEASPRGAPGRSFPLPVLLGVAVAALVLGLALGWLLAPRGAQPAAAVPPPQGQPPADEGPPLIRLETEPDLHLGVSRDGTVFTQLILAVGPGETTLVDLQGRATPIALLGDVPFEPILDGHRYFEVLRVIDGDTVLLALGTRTMEVRLLGVDTPEVKDPRKPVQFWGAEASAYTKKALEGAKIRLEFDPENRMDVYGRLLAYVHVLDGEEEIDFCKRMIVDGFARVFERDWCDFNRLEEFLVDQKAARRKGIGVWDEEAEDAWHQARIDAEEALERDAKFVTTRGSEVYHVRDCSRAPAEKNWIFLLDEAAAEAEGLRPHSCAE